MADISSGLGNLRGEYDGASRGGDSDDEGGISSKEETLTRPVGAIGCACVGKRSFPCCVGVKGTRLSWADDERQGQGSMKLAWGMGGQGEQASQWKRHCLAGASIAEKLISARRAIQQEERLIADHYSRRCNIIASHQFSGIISASSSTFLSYQRQKSPLSALVTSNLAAVQLR